MKKLNINNIISKKYYIQLMIKPLIILLLFLGCEDSPISNESNGFDGLELFEHPIIRTDDFGNELDIGEESEGAMGCEIANSSDNRSISIVSMPSDFSLGAPYPNPTNGPISFNLLVPSDTFITISIHEYPNIIESILNLSGDLVREMNSDNFNSGYHTITWDGFDDEDEFVSDGYYQIIVNTDEGECFANILIDD